MMALVCDTLIDRGEGGLARELNLFSPVGGGDPDLACNHGGKEGTPQVAEAAAGSQITFDWVYVGTIVL